MKQYIVDAFTNQLFHGNQAAVCVLDEWLPEELMMNITRENNFSETAFTVKTDDGYGLRWFTPGGEISLCGHATLGTSYVLFRFYEQNADRITFHTRMSGDLFIRKSGDKIVMNFPAYRLQKTVVTEEMADAFGTKPEQAFIDRDLLLVYSDEAIIRNMKPDFEKVIKLPGEGVSVTAPGKSYDCVSRFFDPKMKVNEDPVTGSAHCMIAPYWGHKLEKDTIHAYQASKRGGELWCSMKGKRVEISGNAVLYSISELYLPKREEER